jgi:hypothetical protein
MNSDSLDDDPPDPLGVERENPLPAVFGTVRQRLKDQSKSAATTGTNPIFARRLVEHDLETNYGSSEGKVEIDGEKLLVSTDDDVDARDTRRKIRSLALPACICRQRLEQPWERPTFVRPSPIQAAAIPSLARASR